MTDGKRRRRLRVGRKRKTGSLAAELAVEAGEEVIAQAGCCLVEAVLSASVVLALLTVPVLLALR